eukprot:693899-Pyramimonas_sp.AAC.1
MGKKKTSASVATSSHDPSLWTKCKNCGKCEWNVVIQQHGGWCKCGKQVELFRPSPKKGDSDNQLALRPGAGGGGSPTTSAWATPSTELEAYKQALLVATDPGMRKLLELQ